MPWIACQSVGQQFTRLLFVAKRQADIDLFQDLVGTFGEAGLRRQQILVVEGNRRRQITVKRGGMRSLGFKLARQSQSVLLCGTPTQGRKAHGYQQQNSSEPQRRHQPGAQFGDGIQRTLVGRRSRGRDRITTTGGYCLRCGGTGTRRRRCRSRVIGLTGKRARFGIWRRLGRLSGQWRFRNWRHRARFDSICWFPGVGSGGVRRLLHTAFLQCRQRRVADFNEAGCGFQLFFETRNPRSQLGVFAFDPVFFFQS